MKVDRVIPLEEVYHMYQNVSKLHRGRPEMIVMKLTNKRNIQMFRGGRVQILGRVFDEEAENMRLEFITKLRQIKSMQHFQATKWTISNLVMSVRLKNPISLQTVALNNKDFYHDIELFPAAFMRRWQPVHVTVFRSGTVVLTGLKSVEHFEKIMPSLNSVLKVGELTSYDESVLKMESDHMCVCDLFVILGICEHVLPSIMPSLNSVQKSSKFTSK